MENPVTPGPNSSISPTPSKPRTSGGSPTIIGCAFLVDYRRHCHDAFLLLTTAIWLRGSQLSRANSSAHAELSLIDMLPRAAIGLRMVAAANLVEVAALVGDTARAT